MSVTFAVEFLPTGSFTITCSDAEEVARADSIEGIEQKRTEHMAQCEDCEFYGCYPSPVWDVDESVNFSNLNARALGFVLDLDMGEDLTGSIDPADLLARIEIALALGSTAEAARPTVEVGGTPGTGARWIECGISEQDVIRRLGELRRVALVALELGRSVQWS
jgi:hypothetical protein